MVINKFLIFNLYYNYIDNNKQEVDNWIHVPNTDPLVLLPTTYNIICKNYCSIIIFNQNSRHTNISLDTKRTNLNIIEFKFYIQIKFIF